jgi:hypothetical protein
LTYTRDQVSSFRVALYSSEFAESILSAIGLLGALTFGGTGCKKDFNIGVLPIAHIWSHIDEREKL